LPCLHIFYSLLAIYWIHPYITDIISNHTAAQTLGRKGLMAKPVNRGEIQVVSCTCRMRNRQARPPRGQKFDVNLPYLNKPRNMQRMNLYPQARARRPSVEFIAVPYEKRLSAPKEAGNGEGK